MKRTIIRYGWLAGLTLLGISGTSQANIFYMDLGSAAPPGALDVWNMVAFPADGRGNVDVNSVTDPYSRLLTFSQDVRHDQVGSSWATWSHGYAGDVYDTAGSLSLALGLPNPVHAFYFYVEPVNFSDFAFTATDQNGATYTQTVNGFSGASGFGFYTDASQLITAITVTTTDADGFAIGEFAVNQLGAPGPGSVPDSGATFTYAILSLLPMCGYALRFRRQK